MQGLNGGLFSHRAGDEDEWDFGAFLSGGGQRRQAVVGRQRVIGQDEVRRVVTELGQKSDFGRDTFPRELEAGFAQLAHDQFGVGGPVFEDQDAEFAVHAVGRPTVKFSRLRPRRAFPAVD